MACCLALITHHTRAHFKSAPLIAESTNVCSDMKLSAYFNQQLLHSKQKLSLGEAL
jgi:hypothetical protein